MLNLNRTVIPGPEVPRVFTVFYTHLLSLDRVDTPGPEVPLASTRYFAHDCKATNTLGSTPLLLVEEEVKAHSEPRVGAESGPRAARRYEAHY